MRLKGERILLRPFKLSDAEDLLDVVNEKDIRKYLPGVWTDDIAVARRNISIYKNANFVDDVYLAIIDNFTQKVIGMLICVRIVSRNMEIAYCISQNRRGEGLTLEALLLFLAWYNKQDIRNNILFDVLKENAASIRLIEKLKSSGICVIEYGAVEDKRRYVIYVDAL